MSRTLYYGVLNTPLFCVVTLYYPEHFLSGSMVVLIREVPLYIMCTLMFSLVDNMIKNGT